MTKRIITGGEVAEDIQDVAMLSEFAAALTEAGDYERAAGVLDTALTKLYEAQDEVIDRLTGETRP